MAEKVFIENEGALFRGHSRAWPDEVWSERHGEFRPYEGRVPKPIEWGSTIGEDEAREMMGHGQRMAAE